MMTLNVLSFILLSRNLVSIEPFLYKLRLYIYFFWSDQTEAINKIIKGL